MERIVVAFNESSYSEALREQKRKLTAFNDLMALINRDIKIPEKEMPAFRKDPWAYYVKALPKPFESLGLDFDEVVRIKNIDTFKVREYMRNYRKIEVDETREIKRADYEQVIETPEQLKRYNHAKALIDAIMTIKNEYGHTTDMVQLSTRFKCLNFDFEKGLVPSASFVFEVNMPYSLPLIVTA